MKKLFLAVSLAASAGLMQGCVAVPIIAAANMLHKSGDATFEVSGAEKAFPGAFRSAVQRAGGVVTATSNDYGHAMFSKEQVKVEYQKIGVGTYQVIASNSSTVARSYDFSDSISVKSEAVANSLTAAGYTTKASSRQRGL